MGLDVDNQKHGLSYDYFIFRNNNHGKISFNDFGNWIFVPSAVNWMRDIVDYKHFVQIRNTEEASKSKTTEMWLKALRSRVIEKVSDEFIQREVEKY